MLRLKICVSAGAIIGAAIFKNLALIWSDPLDMDTQPIHDPPKLSHP